MRTFVFAAAAICASSAGCMNGSSSSSSPVEPNCADPAPLRGDPGERMIGYIVQFNDGIDALDETARLHHVYDFEPTYVTMFIPVFFANFSDDIRDRLRCEPAVKAIEYDGPGTPPP